MRTTAAAVRVLALAFALGLGVGTAWPQDARMAAMARQFTDAGFAQFAERHYLAAEQEWERALAVYEYTDPPAGAALRQRIFAGYLGMASSGKFGNPLELAASVHVFGAFLGNAGHFADGIRLSRTAFRLREKMLGPEHPATLDSEFNLALFYTHQNQLENAQPHFEHVLAVRQRTAPDDPATADVLINLGDLHALRGERTPAIDMMRRGLAIQERAYGADDPRLLPVLVNLGSLLEHDGDLAGAEAFLKRALVLAQREDVDAVRAELPLTNLARVYVDAGRVDDALAAARQATRLAARRLQRDDLAGKLTNLSAVYDAAHKSGLAILLGKLAVNVAQDVRQHGDALPHGLRLRIEAVNNQPYRRLAAQLLRADRIAEARQVFERMRDEDYREFLGVDVDTARVKPPMAFTPEEQPWAQTLGTLLAQMRQTEIMRSDNGPQSTPVQRDLNQRFDAALDTAAVVLAENPVRRDPDARIAPPVQVVEMRLGRLAADAAWVQYLILPDRLLAYVVANGHGSRFDLPVREAVLNHQLRVFQNALMDPSNDPRPAGKALYDSLIAPLEPALTGKHTLVLALDGVMRYVPFAALYDGEQYLLERWRVVRDVGVDQPTTRLARPWRVTAMGSTRGAPGLAPLPWVRDELSAIVGPGRLSGAVWLDADFTAARLSAALENGNPVLHLATHFHFSLANERDAFLLLGDGNRLSLAELRTGPYRFAGLDLVTLSACDTALSGGRDADGRQIDGLARLVLEKGAASVLASLWPIADKSTSVLMARFYGGHEHLGKAAALRRAQLALLHGSASGSADESAARSARLQALLPSEHGDFVPPPGAPYAHPYYWAGFVLMGDGN